jgi:hypothetical protein
MKRMSISMQKLTESRSRETGLSNKSGDLPNPMMSALEQIVGVNAPNDTLLNEDDQYIAEIEGP